MHYKIVSKPKILLREDTGILLSWDEVYSIENADNRSIKYKLQIDDKINGWKTIYWGPKTSKKVDGLGVCDLYFFRLCFISANFTSEWTNFRAGTDCGPYLVMHMTRALQIGSTSTIRKLAQLRPILLELENKELKTPLMQVIEKNDVHMTHFLLNMGASANTSTLIGKRTALMTSIYKGYIQIASLLVDKGANLHATDINQLTALHYAVDSNAIECVKFAVEAGCDLNARDSKGWTPLIRSAVLNCDIDIVDYLIKSGADKSAKDNNGFDFDKHCQLSDANYSDCLEKLETKVDSPS